MMVGENICYPKAIVAGDLSLNGPHFGSSGSLHDGSSQRIWHVCFVDSRSFAAGWHSSILLGQFGVADGDIVVAVGVAVGIDHTTTDQTTDWLVASIECCSAEVDTVGDVDGVGYRCSANVHHDSAVDRIVGSCLVHGHLFGSVYYAAACWSEGPLWHDVQVADLMVLVEHGIAPLSAVPVLLVVAFHFFQAVLAAIFLCDLDRFVGSRIVRGDDWFRMIWLVLLLVCRDQLLHVSLCTVEVRCLCCLLFLASVQKWFDWCLPNDHDAGGWLLGSCAICFSLSSRMQCTGVVNENHRSQSESLRPKSYTKRCFGCSVSVSSTSSEKADSSVLSDCRVAPSSATTVCFP